MSIEFFAPKISFIVTCYNKEQFIEECLLSIKEQSWVNKELIVVDDCSTDKSLEVVEKFAVQNSDMSIKILRNNKNIGQLASFLEGIKNADGEFVTLTDGDDVLFAEFAAAHINTHLHTTVAMTSARQIEIDEKGVVHSFMSADCPFHKPADFTENIKFDPKMYSCEFEEKDFDVKFLSNKKYPFATWYWSPSTSAVIRKSVCEMLLKLKNPSEIKITADKFIFSFAHIIGSSALINAPLYAYRRHSSNYSLANKMTGSNRYLKKGTQKNYIRNNFLIRGEMWKFITSNKKYFEEQFNHAGYIGLLHKIIFSFDLSTLKSALKSLWV
ncbi:MAG: glycosyltransferase [Candidatus Gastranaerophilales bacterium]|nr:glycosyltransferase [Candidatus Gastranaerophilales bacterium]